MILLFAAPFANQTQITAELQSLTPSNLVVLYELDTRPIGGTEVLRFHAGVNALGSDVVWDGKTYSRFPVEVSGFERTSSGTLPRPKMVVANIDGLTGALARELGGLEGAKLTRTRTFLKYLDEANFSNGNLHADPSQYIERDTWYVSRKSSENRMFLEYELSASFDLSSIKLPRRQFIQNCCTWRYRSAECGYAGGPVATELDAPTTNPALDRCGKRLKSCELRFGKGSVLPIGAFPGVGMY